MEVAATVEPLDVTEDTMLSGEVGVTTFTVAAGVTVTASGDFSLTASETVNIAGTLTGTCTDVSIQAVGIVTLSGTVSTTCATEPAGGGDVPGVTIISDEAFSLQGAVITTSGDVILRSNTAVAASPAGRARAARASFDPTCFINNSSVTLTKAGSGEDGGTTGSDGGDGRSIEASCGRDRVVISGSFLTAAPGGDGGDAESADATIPAQAGNGGSGGGVTLRSEVGISFTTSRSFITAGDGGNGGGAEAFNSENAEAFGGDGGSGGLILVEIPANAGDIFIEDLDFLDISLGTGGKGGLASASASSGDDATATEAAKKGGDARAEGGHGGDNYPTENPALFGDLIPRGIGFTGSVEFSGGGSGEGGEALAQGGSGGNGNEEFPDGAKGGTMNSWGGHGGKLQVKENRNEDTYPGAPGDGAMATLIEGPGGNGWDDCVVGNIKAGGKGGAGGDGFGSDGNAGQGFDGSNMGTSKGVLIWAGTGNGGWGGDGVEPGTGGPGGTNGVTSMGPLQDEGSFEPGPDGSECDKPLTSTISVISDPDSHEMILNLTSVGTLVLELLPGNDLRVTGSTPWVDLDGFVVFSAILQAWTFNVQGTSEGRTYTLTGELTLDEDGRAIGFTGTLQVDVPMYDPVTYSVTGTMSMAAATESPLSRL